MFLLVSFPSFIYGLIYVRLRRIVGFSSTTHVLIIVTKWIQWLIIGRWPDIVLSPWLMPYNVSLRDFSVHLGKAGRVRGLLQSGGIRISLYFLWLTSIAFFLNQSFSLWGLIFRLLAQGESIKWNFPDKIVMKISKSKGNNSPDRIQRWLDTKGKRSRLPMSKLTQWFSYFSINYDWFYLL